MKNSEFGEEIRIKTDVKNFDPFSGLNDAQHLLQTCIWSIRLQLFSKCSFNPMSVIGYDVGKKERTYSSYALHYKPRLSRFSALQPDITILVTTCTR